MDGTKVLCANNTILADLEQTGGAGYGLADTMQERVGNSIKNNKAQVGQQLRRASEALK